MSGKEIKTQVKEMVNTPAKAVSFSIHVITLVLVSLCLKAVNKVGEQAIEPVVSVIRQFKQLQVDRDSDKMEHTEIVRWQAKTDHEIKSISDTLNNVVGVVDAHQGAIEKLITQRR